MNEFENNIAEETNLQEEVTETTEFYEGETNLTENEETAEDTTEVTEDGEETEAETNATEETPSGTEGKKTITHLGREIEVTEEDLIALAQKGMDYDYQRKQTEQLKAQYESADGILEIIDAEARSQGMTRAQYTQYMQNYIRENQVNAYIANGMTEADARRKVEVDQANNAAAAKYAEMQRQQEIANAEQNRTNQMLVQFAMKYPEVKTLPQEVLDRVKVGEHAIVAYQDYLLKQSKQAVAEATTKGEQKALNTVKATSKASPGSLKGGEAVKKDISKMSDEEFAALRERVMNGEQINL